MMTRAGAGSSMFYATRRRLQERKSRGGAGRHTSCCTRTRGRHQSTWQNRRLRPAPRRPFRALPRRHPRRALLLLLAHHFGPRHQVCLCHATHRYENRCHGLRRRTVSRFSFSIKMNLLLRFRHGPPRERRHRALCPRHLARHRHVLYYRAVGLSTMRSKLAGLLLPLRFLHGPLCERRPRALYPGHSARHRHMLACRAALGCRAVRYCMMTMKWRPQSRQGRL